MGTLDDPLMVLFSLLDSIEFALMTSAPRQVKASDEWFWTRGWQKAEREANDDLKAGRYEDFDAIEQMVRVLLQNVATDDPQQLDRLAAALRQGRKGLR
jgi:hypothetical protein